MYNYGLVKFLQAKKLKSNECINAFLKAEDITEFTAKHHNRVNSYIEKHWTKFSSFVDRGIKDGTLQGKAVKLNTYFDEQREYRSAVKSEFENANLTAEQQKILNEIKQNGVGKLQSVMMKAGVNPVGKNYECKAKILQWLPVVNQAIENGISI
jgi:flagellar motility protein MotE (MotC chaperone)